MKGGTKNPSAILGVFGILLAFASSGPASAQVCVEPPDGLVSWWPGDGTTEDLAGGHDGTLLNGAFFAPGMSGSAFGFDGVDDIVDVWGFPDITSALTVEAWVNPADYGCPFPGGRRIVNKLSTSLRGWNLDVFCTNARLRAELFDPSGATNSVSSTIPIPAGVFSHVAFSWDGSSLKLYINGAVNNTAVTSIASIAANTEPLRIGRWLFAENTFKGRIDEPTVFDRALSASEIRGIYNAGLAGKCKLPLADGGPDSSPDEGAVVTLDGSASRDPLGKPISYSWTQIAGPSVTLTDPDSSMPSFTAPFVPAGGATLTFQLVVASPLGSGPPDTVNVTVTNVNHPPVPEAGDDQIVPESSAVSLNGTASYDQDDETLSFSWVQTAGTLVGLAGADTATPGFIAPLVGTAGETLTFALTVGDGIDTATDSVDVFVTNVNQAPVANAGSDASANENTVVALDSSASHDPDEDSLTYAWTQTGGTAVMLSDAFSATPSFTAPLTNPGGEVLTFDLVVSDGQLDSVADSVAIVVLNVNDPPNCALASTQPAGLWPPNHKLVAVGLSGVVDPQGDVVTLAVSAVTSDEPTSGLGDGDSSPDAVLQGSSVLLRAERWDQRDGRVYMVHFTATDTNGESCFSSVQVTVPKTMKKGSSAVDSGQGYDATLP